MSETGNRMTVETKPESVSPACANNPVDPGRRAALAKLGLAVGVAYATPMILKLDRAANAAILPTPCPPPDGNCGNNPASCPC
ncbi:MAG: hypothetical protein O3A96_01680 [Proteobacteria bacterium]|nr:hypothetical protein [Pseudomonadota bacterium]